MTVTITGVESAQAALNEAIRDINVESELLLTAILQGISANTTPYIPVDTATLVNSEVREVHMEREGPVGSISYGLNGAVSPHGTPVSQYAVFVHEGPQKNWQKPGASNRFLERGVRDFIQDDLSSVIARFQP